MMFLVLSLPRSRSAWLARFLSYGDWRCGHEELRHLRSLDDVATWFSQPCTGTAETAAAPWWRLIPDGVKLVTVRRPVGEVVESLLALPLPFDRDALTAGLEYHDRKLDQIEARLPCLSVRYDELNDEAVCQRIFEYCLPCAHDHEHWARLQVNVQCDMVALTRYTQAFRPALDKLGRIARHEILARMALREPIAPDGMTFQTEDIDSWVEGAQRLFDEHSVIVGEAPGSWQDKNAPLMHQLYKAGAMQIMTARSNGRMFGYLVTLISPSIHRVGGISAANSTFYASPDVPGLGMKLQRAALNALKERGATEVFFEAGKRGSGPRLSTMFRRLGAEEHGEVYRLELMGN